VLPTPLSPYTTLFRSDTFQTTTTSFSKICVVPGRGNGGGRSGSAACVRVAASRPIAISRTIRVPPLPAPIVPNLGPGRALPPDRSEEHTSELQSRENL